MKQKEFKQLSENEVLELNCGDESCCESWRSEYIYAQKMVDEWRNKLYYEQFMEQIESFCEDELDYFNW